MRTTVLVEKRGFYDDLFCARYIFIFDRKGWVESKLVEIQRERKREVECCYKRVVAWAINLAVGQIFMTARVRIIRNLIKMNIRIIFKNLECYFPLGTLTFHLHNKPSLYHKVS